MINSNWTNNMLKRFRYVTEKLRLLAVILIRRDSRHKNYLTPFLVSHLIITSSN